jgi:hypothetical protein
VHLAGRLVSASQKPLLVLAAQNICQDICRMTAAWTTPGQFLRRWPHPDRNEWRTTMRRTTFRVAVASMLFQMLVTPVVHGQNYACADGSFQADGTSLLRRCCVSSLYHFNFVVWHPDIHSYAECFCIMQAVSSACVTETGDEGTCLGPCVTIIDRLSTTCSDHASLSGAAASLSGTTDGCSQIEGCMDERYTTYAIEHNVQASAASCVDSDAPSLILNGQSQQTLTQACGRSYDMLDSPCTEEMRAYTDASGTAVDAVEGDVSAQGETDRGFRGLT